MPEQSQQKTYEATPELKAKRGVVSNIMSSINTGLDLLMTEIEEMRDILKAGQAATDDVEIKVAYQNDIDKFEEAIQALEEFDLRDLLGRFSSSNS